MADNDVYLHQVGDPGCLCEACSQYRDRRDLDAHEAHVWIPGDDGYRRGEVCVYCGKWRKS